jgi:hypothetical protein
VDGNLTNLIKSKYKLYLVFIILLLFLPSYHSPAESKWWDNDWSFSQKIIIPFDTSSDIAHFQPIDIKIDFENPCWVRDEEQHSIRIVFLKSGEFTEIDSQIYNLNYSDETHINSCNIVFLIPEEADGGEEYFIYYDDSEKISPGYVDHVKIDESYYRFEPISGYSLESSYYKITDDEHL